MDTRRTDAAILIPCYNAEMHLSQCLESALAQGFPILMCDDGSTDSSLAIAQKYPIQIIRNSQNLGVGRTRQKLIDFAKNLFNPEFIQFLDADDYFLSNKIANQLAKKDAADILIDPLLFLYPDGKMRPIKIGADLFAEAKQRRIWQLNSCLFKTKTIPVFRPINACSDALFLIDCLKAGLRAKQVSATPTSVYRCNWGPHQITANFHREREDLSAIFDRELQELDAIAKLA